jgi:hypothetical protein
MGASPEAARACPSDRYQKNPFRNFAAFSDKPTILFVAWR